MKFTCNQNNFLDVILTVQKAVSTRTTMPILEGILIETKKDVLKLTATDLDLGIESYMEARIYEEGKIVLPARLLTEIIRKLPNSEMEVTVLDNNSVRINCLNSMVTIQGLPAKEFPELPAIDENQPLEINKMLFDDMIKQTIFAVAVDETRPILTGALLEINDSNVYLVALDGYRLALREAVLDAPCGNLKVVIPGKSLSEISKIISGEDQKMSVTVSNRHVLFDLGYTRIISRILEGEFINYRQIIPQEYSTRVKVDTKILSSSIERASLIAREGKNNLIKLSIQDQRMVITSNSEVGTVYEEIPIILEGKEMEIAFNARYFMDMLKAIDDQEICMDFTTSVSPCVVRPLEGTKYTYLLLPVRIFS